MSMEHPSLPAPAVLVHVAAEGWQDAVRWAGRALASAGDALPEYGERMVDMVDEHGPYIVIAPGIALAHARPGEDVLRTGWSVVTLAEPVLFGHPHHDPVSVVVGFAATDPEAHVSGVARIANLFNDESLVRALVDAPDAERVRALLA